MTIIDNSFPNLPLLAPPREIPIPESTPAHLRQYQANVNARRRSPYLDFPQHVHLETLSLCNANCTFCPYGELDRKNTRMPDELINKVLTDLEDIPRIVPFQLSPFKVNEPFLDKRLFDVLERVTTRLPHATITLTTNSTPLTDEKLDRLAEFSHLGYLWISFNDHRPEQYTATMRLPYDRTIQRLRAIHDRKAAGRLRIRVVLSRVGDSSPVDREFASFVGQQFPLFEAAIFPRGGWLGQVPGLELGPVPQVGCSRWFDLSITATGVVAHCCMDGKAEHPIGDIRTQHALEIYNQPAYRALRERAMTRADAAPCNTCTFL